jgi:WD40 repeat protein
VIAERRTLTAGSLAVAAALAASCTAPAPPAAPQAAAAPTGAVPVAVTITVQRSVTSLERVNGTSTIVVGLADGHVALWNGRDAAPGTMWKPHAARVVAVGSSADGREVWSVAEDGSLARTPATPGARSTTRKIDLGAAATRAAAFAPDGSQLVTGGEFGDIRVYDTATGALRHHLRGHRTEIQAIAVRGGTPIVASASAESDLRIWDAAAGGEIRSIDSDLSLFALAFSPRGDIFVSGGVDRRLTWRDPDSWSTTGELRLQAPRLVAALAWSPDGRFLALADTDDETLSKGSIDLVDAGRRAVVATLETGGMPTTNLAVLPDGLVVAASRATLRSWMVPGLAATSH